MYTQADIRDADVLVRRYKMILIAALLPMLAAYVWAVIAGRQLLMLVILLAAFWFSALEAALFLRPAMQYRSFLKDMSGGLRRECVCAPDALNPTVQIQDGVRVHALQVRLDDGDTRVFYINASKTDLFPMDAGRMTLVSYGRHVVDWRNEE